MSVGQQRRRELSFLRPSFEGAHQGVLNSELAKHIESALRYDEIPFRRGSKVVSTGLADTFTLEPTTLVWCLVAYGFVASVLPVWMLLAPRDYLSTFIKVGTILLLAIGILVTLPVMKTQAVTDFASNGQGPVFEPFARIGLLFTKNLDRIREAYKTAGVAEGLWEAA